MSLDHFKPAPDSDVTFGDGPRFSDTLCVQNGWLSSAGQDFATPTSPQPPAHPATAMLISFHINSLTGPFRQPPRAFRGQLPPIGHQQVFLLASICIKHASQPSSIETKVLYNIEAQVRQPQQDKTVKAEKTKSPTVWPDLQNLNRIARHLSQAAPGSLGQKAQTAKYLRAGIELSVRGRSNFASAGRAS